jgi:hypothetical protein
MRIIAKDLVLTLFTVGLSVMALSAQQPQPPSAHPPLGVPPAATAQPATNAGPNIQFATPIYDFGKAKCGDVVKYTYYFTNTGVQTLELNNVQGSCGCTAVGNWSRKVEPGQTGEIPIQFNSANFNGPVFKTVTVFSNIKPQSTTVLQLKGTIWKPIDVQPAWAVLNVPADGAASATVRIINNMEEEVTIEPPVITNHTFTAELKTTKPGKEYQLIVSAVPPLSPGNLQQDLLLKTSSTNAPTVAVKIWANIQPLVTVMPVQITLPPPPLAHAVTNMITIHNNSTNAMTLSDATCSLEGVDVQLKELQAPGRAFVAMLVFPEGFELQPGHPVIFTVKSSHVQQPLIKVPITQMAKPVAAPAAPGPRPGVPTPPTLSRPMAPPVVPPRPAR